MAEAQEAEITLLILSQICSVRGLLSIGSRDFLFEFLLEYSLLINSVVLVSALQQSESVIHVHIHTLF